VHACVCVCVCVCACVRVFYSFPATFVYQCLCHSYVNYFTDFIHVVFL
jgi:hypothetical protein